MENKLPYMPIPYEVYKKSITNNLGNIVERINLTHKIIKTTVWLLAIFMQVPLIISILKTWIK